MTEDENRSGGGEGEDCAGGLREQEKMTDRAQRYSTEVCAWKE